jgi:hypothetical protein
LDEDRAAAAYVIHMGTRSTVALQGLLELSLMLLFTQLRFAAVCGLAALAVLLLVGAAAQVPALAQAWLALRRFVVLFRIPHPPEEGLLLGSVLPMRRKDHHRTLRAWAKRLGGVYAIRIAFWHVSGSPHQVALLLFHCWPSHAPQA